MIKAPRTIGFRLHAPGVVLKFLEINAIADKLISSTPSNEVAIRAAARLLKVLCCILTDRRNLEVEVKRVIYRKAGTRMISDTAFDYQSAPAQPPMEKWAMAELTESEGEFLDSIYPDMPDFEFWQAIVVFMLGEPEDESQDLHEYLEEGSEDDSVEILEDYSEESFEEDLEEYSEERSHDDS